MNHVTHLTDPQDSRLENYRNLRRAEQGDFFVVEGFYLVERLIASDYEVKSIVVSVSSLERVLALLDDGTPIFVLANSDIERLTGFAFHRGVLACGERKATLKLEEVLHHNAARTTLLVLPHIHDQTNLGSILRNCAAFGVDGVVLGPKCTDPLGRRTLRVSMGASLSRSILQVDNIVDVLQRVRTEFGVQLVAATTSQQAMPMDEFIRAERIAILLGPEDQGLSDELLFHCDSQVTIPMAPAVDRAGVLPTDSLNVAVSSGILLYGLTRHS